MSKLRFAALALVPMLFGACKKESEKKANRSAFSFTASANKAMRINFRISRPTSPNTGVTVETVELYEIIQPYEFHSDKAQIGDNVTAEVSISGVGELNAEIKSFGKVRSERSATNNSKGRSSRYWNFDIQ